MTRLTISGILSDAVRLARRHGVATYVDFFAAGVLMTTLGLLLDEGRIRARLSGQGPTTIEGAIAENVLFNPLAWLGSAVFTVVAAAVFLRIFWAEEGEAPPPETRSEMVRENLFALIFLQVAVDLIFSITLYVWILPAVVLAAATMFLIPAVLVERRGVTGFGRALSLALPHLLRLSILWVLILLPWILILVVTDIGGPAMADASRGELWRAQILTDIFSTVFIAFVMFCTVAAYRQLLNGPHERKVDDVFR